MYSRSTRGVLIAAAAAVGLGTACQDSEMAVPSAEVVESYYTIPVETSVEVSGNVAVLEVYQSSRQLRRGGRLWAKVGPYIYLFSEPTQRLFEDHPGLAALRVVTRAPDGDEIARATLRRDALNELTWRRALNISGLARRDGTDRPTRLEDLVDWGEEHTSFEYSETYVGSH